jgi:transcriptional regulator with XRE-family HTH domain
MTGVDSMKLKELRRLALMTQEDLAKESGVSRDTIWRLEHGKTGAHPRNIKKLAAALGIDPRDLLED